jgi:hypothetical protein
MLVVVVDRRPRAIAFPIRLVLRKLSKISGKMVMKLTFHTGDRHKKRGSFF